MSAMNCKRKVTVNNASEGFKIALSGRMFARPFIEELVSDKRLGIGDEILLHLIDRVTAEFLAHCIRQDDREHRLANYAGGRHDGNVGSLIGRFARLFRVDVDRLQSFSERGDRFQVTAHPQLFAVRYSAFETAGAVCSADERRLETRDRSEI